MTIRARAWTALLLPPFAWFLFQQGLSALKKGTTGDIANFKGYTVKRVDVKGTGVWYTLSFGEGELTNFQQSDADKMVATIKAL